MMSDEEILAGIRTRIESDHSGETVGAYIAELKDNGLQKRDAERLLTTVMMQHQVPSSDQFSRDKEEGIAAVLDRVTGWCSHRHIYPRG